MSAPAVEAEVAVCIGHSLSTRRPCESKAAVHLTAGCVHEHIVEADLCQKHIEIFATVGNACGYCDVCDDPHFCELSPIKVEDLP